MLCSRMKMLGALIVGVLLAGASVGLVTHRLLARETSEANDGLLAGPADGEKGKGTGRDGHEPGQPEKEAKGSGAAPAAEKSADKKCLPPVSPPYEEKTVRLPGDDWLVYRYHPMMDSGVQVFRTDANFTRIRWSSKCGGLGILHSKYSHNADVEIRKGEAVVKSAGGRGSNRFEERLNLDTGELIERTESFRPPFWPRRIEGSTSARR